MEHSIKQRNQLYNYNLQTEFLPVIQSLCKTNEQNNCQQKFSVDVKNNIVKNEEQYDSKTKKWLKAYY